MDEQKLTIGLPMDFLTTLDGISLPPNIEKYFDEYLNREDIKESELYNTIKKYKKYAGYAPVMGEVISYMFKQDLPFMESYNALKERLIEMLAELDDLYSCVFTDEMVSSLFDSMFSGIINLGHKITQDRANKGTNQDVIYVNALFNEGEVDEKLKDYGLSNVISRLVSDEEVKSSIETNYVKPLKEILEEYMCLFFDSESEEEMMDIFSNLFIGSESLIANQSLLDIITNEVIKSGLNVSETLGGINADNLFNKAKENILSYTSMLEYKEDIANALKKVLESQTQ